MPSVVIDIRANHATGISRYGLSLVQPLTQAAHRAGWRTTVVCDHAQAPHAARNAGGTGTEIVATETEGFVRRSPALHHVLQRVNADIYYTTHYTVDRHCPVPFVFTIHDLTRIRYPHLSYTDESFAARFGPGELALIRQEALALGVRDDKATNTSIFARYFHALTLDLARRAQRITTVSKASALDIRRILGDDTAPIDLVPCAVDTTVFYSRPHRQVAAARRRHGLEGPYALAVGLSHPNPRLPWLIDQFARARHLLPAASRLAIVGGYAEDDRAVQQAVRQSGAESSTTFTGRVDDAELAALYTGASALVSASVSEGYCLPPVEAAACGTPVIAADVPVLRETLGPSGFFFPADDGHRLRDLAAAALHGRLAARGPGGPVGSWEASGAALFASLSAAVAATTGGRAARR
jgi:glycosyltransferase involved in cell wall biosynthesis